jgi:hypothetical protein
MTTNAGDRLIPPAMDITRVSSQRSKRAHHYNAQALDLPVLLPGR